MRTPLMSSLGRTLLVLVLGATAGAAAAQEPSSPPPPPSEEKPQPQPIPPPPPPPASQPTQSPAPASPPTSGSQPAQPPPSARTTPAPPPTPPGPGDAEVTAGLQALQQGDLQVAKQHFEKALALDPNHQVARSRMAYLRFRKRDYAGAAADAETAVRLDPNDSLSYVILGRSREALGEAEKAAAAYTAAAGLTAKAVTQERVVASALAHYLRAMQRLQKGETTDVENDLKEVLRVYPKNAYAQYELALFLLRSGRAAEAVDAFKTAAETAGAFQPQESWLYPSRRYLFLDANIRYWRGAALRQAARLDEAIAELEPLFPKVEAMAGSEMTAQSSSASAALEGKVETSFLNAHYEAALAYEAKGDKARALALVKTYQRLGLGDAETLRQSRELQKRLK